MVESCLNELEWFSIVVLYFQLFNVLFLFFIICFLWNIHKAHLNPCPAEPGYTLPLQTV